MIKKIIIINFLLLIAGAGTALAQPGGYAGAFSRIGFGPRGISMGNAMAADTTEGIYGYYNPAQPAWVRGNQLDFSTSVMSFGRRLSTFQATFALPPAAGVSVALINARTADFDGRSRSGYHTGTFNSNEYQLIGSFGIQFSDHVSAGGGLKLNVASFHPDISNEAGIGIDLGTLFQLTDRLHASVTVRDLLSVYSWNAIELYGGDNLALRHDYFPVRLESGLSYTIPYRFTVAAFYGRLTHSEAQFNQLKAGASYHIHERITVRAGVQVDDIQAFKDATRPSAGFSVHLPFDEWSPSIDYAFAAEPGNISTMHVFGIRLNI